MNSILFTPRYRCDVAVMDERNHPLPDASVVLSPVNEGETLVQAEYNPASRRFSAIAQSEYVDITVSYEGLETQTRRVHLRTTDFPIVFVMAEPGSSYTYIGGIQIPYTSRPEELAIFMKEGSTAEDENEIGTIVNRHGAEFRILPSGDAGMSREYRRGEGVLQTPKRLLFTSTTPEEQSKQDSIRNKNRGRMLQTLREHSSVEAAGSIFRMYDGVPSLFTNEATVVFFQDVSDTEARELLKDVGFLEARRTEGMLPTYQATGPLELDERINEYLKQLLQTGRVSVVSAGLTVVPRLR